LTQPLYVLSDPARSEVLYVLEKEGRVRRHEGGTLHTALELDVATEVEMGLLGMAFHPKFGPEERRVYVSYVDPQRESRVSSFELRDGTIDRRSEQVLVRVKQPAPNHNGGMVAFGPDGRLYIGFGDGGGRDDQYGNGQNLRTALGSILRIDVAKPEAAPPGNLDSARGDGRILHYGLRNPWRFSFDRLTGDLYIADVGQDHWEEINVVPATAAPTNFGWPTFEGNRRCPGCETNVPPPGPEMRMPVHTYPHEPAASVTGGYVYRGRRIPSLQGRYLYSDFLQNWVRAFTWNGTQACDHLDLTPNLDPEGKLQAVASFGEDAAGELYVVSFAGGEVFRIEPRD
jgi:glucose/arabinose dehydrogenase